MEPIKLTPEQWLVYSNLRELQKDANYKSTLLELEELGLVTYLESYYGEDSIYDLGDFWITTGKHLKTECKLECLQWSRESNGKLYLHVFEEGKWVKYLQAKHYKPDAITSSNSGFATAQVYLSMGFTYKETEQEVDNV
jgi:hypothetical protein